MSGLSIARYFPFMRVKITGQNVHHENASSALIKLEPDKRYRPFCHACGLPVATVHSRGHRRLLRDLNMACAQLWLQVEYRKIWCNNCGGTRVEQLSFAYTWPTDCEFAQAPRKKAQSVGLTGTPSAK